jgi:hypothetical protein
MFRVLTAGSMKVRRDSRLELSETNLLINSVEQEDGGDYDCEVPKRTFFKNMSFPFHMS